MNLCHSQVPVSLVVSVYGNYYYLFVPFYARVARFGSSFAPLGRGS